jgi:eukaryotic-like serine/threonine-protein kinase
VTRSTKNFFELATARKACYQSLGVNGAGKNGVIGCETFSHSQTRTLTVGVLLMDRKAIEQWTVVSKLLDTALDLPTHERQVWLDGLDARYADLKPVLIDLLANQERLDQSELVTPGGASVRPETADSLDVESLASGQLVGAYRLQKEIGRGGMAHVWLAERADGTFERQVALKLPHLNHTRRDLIARFMRERNILAPLEHPNIARLYDAGVSAEGMPYLAMEYVEGQTITQYATEKNLDVPARLKLFLQVLDAVQFAHEHLVIHRDLKPSNILVTNQAQVRLLDFGIAKLLDQDRLTNETELTQVVGRALTLDYASPEQVRGESLTTASDVYSLGVILYELLTGERPYRLKLTTPAQLEQAIVESEPTAPSARIMLDATKENRDHAKRRAKILTGDLDTIVMKALQKKSAARYGSASELALELKRYLAYEPIQAKPDSGWYSFKKFVRRNRLAVAGSTALVVSLAVGLVGTLWQANRAQHETERASSEASAKERESERANRAAIEAQRQALAAEQQRARAEALLKDTQDALDREARATKNARQSSVEALKQRDAASNQAKIAKLEAARAEDVKKFVLATFESPALGAGNTRSTTAVDLLTQARERLKTAALSDATRTELLTVIGTGLSAFGEHQLGEEILAEAANAATTKLNDRGSIAGTAHVEYAWVLGGRGKFREAQSHFDSAEKIFRSMGDKVGLATALGGQANMQGTTRNRVRAIEYAREAVAVAESQSAPVNQRSIMEANMTLSAMLDVDSLSPAKRAYDIAKNLYGGKTSLLYLRARQNYAVAMSREGDPHAALAEFSEIAKLTEKFFGDRTTQHAQALFRIGQALARIGDPQAAFDKLRQAREAQDSVTGGKPSWLGHDIAQLSARVVADLRLYDVSLREDRVSESHKASLLGEKYLQSTVSKLGIARAMLKLGDSGGAEAILEELGANKQLSNKEAFLLKSQRAMLARALGRDSESIKLFREAFELDTEFIDSLTRIDYLCEFADALIRVQKVDQAQTQLQQARAVLSRVERNVQNRLTYSFASADVLIAETKVNLSLSRRNEAILAARNAVSLWEQFDPRHRESGVAKAWLARALRSTGDNAEALEVQRVASEVLRSNGYAIDAELIQ